MTTFSDLALVTITQTLCIILGFSIVGKPLKGYAKQYTNFAILAFLWTFVITFFKYNSQIFQPTLVLIDYCSLIILLKLVFKKNYQRIFLEIIIYVVIYAIIELLAAEIFHLIFKFTFSEFNKINIFIKLSFFEFLLFLVAYRFLPIRDNIERHENVLFKYLLFGLNFFIVFLISMSLIKGLQSNPNLFYLYYFLFFAALLTTYLTIRVFRGPREEKVLREQFLEFEKTLGPVLDELHTIQYDFENHLKTLNELCATVKTELYLTQEVNNARVETPKNLMNIEEPLRFSNKVLEAIVYCKLLEAKAKKIDLRCEIPDEEIEYPLMNYEYTTVIANLLDNANEAVEKTENIEKDSQDIKGNVVLKLGRQDQQCYIEVRNTGSIQAETIPKLFKSGYSTKEEKLGRKRGLGLYNVKKIVDKYNGTIDVRNWVTGETNWPNQVVFRVNFS